MSKIKIKCNQCNASMINGVFCHESGCPNQDKKYNPESESWESVYKCFECGLEYTDSELAGECCAPVELEEEEEEDTPLYDVFIRSWWHYDDKGRLQAGSDGNKRYIAYGVTIESARAICKNYNDNNDPGELSIKAEFESQ